MTVSTYQRPGDIAITDDATAREWMRRCDAAHHVFERPFGWFSAHQVRVGSPQPDMAVELEAGNIFDPGLSGGNATLTELARQIVGGFTAPAASMVRIDRVVVDAITGVASRIAGTAQTGTRAWVYSATDPRYTVSGSPTPQPPAIPWGKLPVCQVLLAAGDAAIHDAMITDERAMKMLNFVDGADFDGTNDYMLRGAGLTGAADSKTGILSVWFRLDAATATHRFIGASATVGVAANRFRSSRLSTGPLAILATDAAGGGVMSMLSATSYSANVAYRHLLASWNAATGAMHMYVDDVEDLDEGASSLLDVEIDYTLADWGIGGDSNAGNKMNGPLAELYLAPGQFLDFSVEANRRKFRDANGWPKFLGHNGSRPTGTAPLVYCGLRDGEAVADFATNRGTGGNYTITGTLDTASSSPSD